MRGRKLKCLVDTGASLNFISSQLMATESVHSWQLPIEASYTKCKVTNNQVLLSQGRVKLPIEIKSQIYSLQAEIVPDLAFDLILGLPFLRHHQCHIDLENNQLILQSPKHDASLALQEDLHLPGFCQTFVDVTCNDLADKKRVLTLVDSLPCLQDRFAAFVARGLCQVENGQARVSLANLSAEPLSLPRGTRVGQYDLVSAAWLNQIHHVNTTSPPTPRESTSRTRLDQSKTTKTPANNFPPHLKFNVPWSNFSETQTREILDLLHDYTDIFAVNSNSPGTTPLVQHRINTDKNQPVHQAPYRVSRHESDQIHAQLTEMLQNNIAQPSMSPFASPVILVPKKDGSIRFCVDYRKLNAITVRDVYPLPRIDDSLTVLNTGKVFTSLDLSSGYWQIPMAPEDKHKTAFVTDRGLFEFNVMPFGLTNAPATFQRFMDAVLAGLKWNILLVYLDDIFVFSPTFEEHLIDLRSTFDRLRQARLRLKASKCHLFQKELLYLGHVVSAEGTRPDPNKIRAVVDFPTPTDKTAAQSLIGLCGYYRNYMKTSPSSPIQSTLSAVSLPVTNLSGLRLLRHLFKPSKACLPVRQFLPIQTSRNPS